MEKSGREHLFGQTADFYFLVVSFVSDSDWLLHLWLASAVDRARARACSIPTLQPWASSGTLFEIGHPKISGFPSIFGHIHMGLCQAYHILIYTVL